MAICAHLPTELKDDLKKVATLSEETHRLTAELSRDQAEILERAKAKYRQVPVQCTLCIHASLRTRVSQHLFRPRDLRTRFQRDLLRRILATLALFDASVKSSSGTIVSRIQLDCGRKEAGCLTLLMANTKTCTAHLRSLLVCVTSDRSSLTEEAGRDDG